MNIFERDLQEAQELVKKARAKGFWMRLLTLGILGNDDGIRRAISYCDICEQHFNEGQMLREQAQEIDRTEGAFSCPGMRVSQYPSADLSVLGKEDYPEDWPVLRVMILERDGYSCQESDGYCSGSLHVHHVRPLTKGGTSDPSNLTTLCEYHHTLRHPHMQRGL